MYNAATAANQLPNAKVVKPPVTTAKPVPKTATAPATVKPAQHTAQIQKVDAKKVDKSKTETDPVSRRVALRKSTVEQIKENQPKNENGEDIDPNDKKPLGDDPTDIGHKPGNEWRSRKEMYEQKGSTRKEVLDEENDPDLYHIERRSNNRSHIYEQKDPPNTNNTNNSDE